MHKKNFYYAATTIAVILWSASFIATKIAYDVFAPQMVGFIRFFVSAILLGAVRIITHERVKPTGKDIRIIALSGLLGITLYFAAENVGVKLTTASNASLIVASYPAITVLFEFIIYRIKPNAKKVIGIVLAFIGIAILTTIQNGDNTSKALMGNLLLIAAGVIWAFYNFITRSVAEKYSPLTLSYYQMLFGTAFFIPLVILEGGTIGEFTISSIIALFYLSIGCSVTAFLLYNFGLKKLSAATSISLMNLVPVFGILFSALLLHETITLRQIVGGIVVIVGVILSTGISETEQKGQ